jgi:hypothetical protein
MLCPQPASHPPCPCPCLLACSWSVCAGDGGGRVWDVYLTRGRPRQVSGAPGARGAGEAGAQGAAVEYGVQVLGRAGETPLEPKTVVVKVGQTWALWGT